MTLSPDELSFLQMHEIPVEAHPKELKPWPLLRGMKLRYEAPSSMTISRNVGDY